MRPQTIPRKFHLGDKSLFTESVPHDITMIEDWAYANCSNLREIYIPAGCTVSDNAFTGCSSLERVFIYDASSASPEDSVLNSSPYLLAKSIFTWPREASVIIGSASDDDMFFSGFDARLCRFLMRDDEEGFEPFQAGGEEDYADISSEKNKYAAAQQILKASMIYERLLCAERADSRGNIAALCDDIRGELILYLAKHNPVPAFSFLTMPSDRVGDHRKLYFELGLNKVVSSEELLEIAGDDTRLRSLVLINSHGSVEL